MDSEQTSGLVSESFDPHLRGSQSFAQQASSVHMWSMTAVDLGCGWGAMLKFLRDSGHQGKLCGLTLAKEQLAYAQQELNLDVKLKNFVTDSFDNRSYDRIFSIGALEHVRPQELYGLYRKIYEALTPGGIAVHQFFSFNKEPYPVSALALQIFFPGSMLVLHHKHLEAANRAGFKITHDSLDDYKPTIRAWYERLAANQHKALKLVSLETYNSYLTFFPIAWLFFQHQEATLHRVSWRNSYQVSTTAAVWG
ncbi:MAG: hypothetical protein BRC58_07360 [Cyanobacteria bacterium QS_8_64_29]|nr:MAG: hypothetical protein BRC58_07360 [Cyanobacteria bacterium QS_8_64_29]